jgi:hypothetical protein
LSALGGVPGIWLRTGDTFGCRRGSARKLTDGRKNFSPVSERNSDVFKILIGQMAEYRDIDSIFGKALGMLGHAKLFKPIRNLLHRSTSCRGFILAWIKLTEFIRQIVILV